jgi:hypothetical protein
MPAIQEEKSEAISDFQTKQKSLGEGINLFKKGPSNEDQMAT